MIDEEAYKNKLGRNRVIISNARNQIGEYEDGLGERFSVNAERILELTKSAESLWKSRNDE